MTEHPKYGYWVKHPVHNPKGTHNTIPLTEADKRNGWTEVVLVAQQPTTHVQNPAESEHVAGDVSKNVAESNMAQQPAPSAAETECVHEWDGLARTSMPPRYACKHCHNFFDAPPFPTPKADSQPAPDEVADAMADSQYLAGVSAGWNAANADDPNAALQKLHESRAGYLKPLSAARAPADSVTAPAGVAYLDIGAGGYIDLGTDLSNEALSRLPKGRHVLIIAGTYGIDGYTPIPPAQAADYDHGPQSETIQEAARHVGKWLNERPNRPLDLRDVAMLCAHAQAADSVLEDAARRTTEQEHAIRQGHEIAASDGYFEARPQIDCIDRRRVFTAGFGRGWDAARKQGGA